eukprot:7334604-Lingulodinium_polyedra.AAC.1
MATRLFTAILCGTWLFRTGPVWEGAGAGAFCGHAVDGAGRRRPFPGIARFCPERDDSGADSEA